VAKRVLATFARFIDGGMLPIVSPAARRRRNTTPRMPRSGTSRRCAAITAATEGRRLLAQLYPALVTSSLATGRDTIRYGRIRPTGSCARAEAGVQVTWMDAKVGDWVVTAAHRQAVEINALWHNAFARHGRSSREGSSARREWEAEATRIATGFDRFWNRLRVAASTLLDGPSGNDPS